MASSFNRVIIMGNLTRDPEMRVTAGGMNIGSFALAVNNRLKDDKESVSYFDCIAFGKQADFAKEHLAKGLPILVEGRLRQSRWEQEGQKRSKIEVVVDSLTFVGPKKNGEDTASETSLPEESDIPY